MFMLMLFGIAPHRNTGNISTNMEMTKISDRFFEKLLGTMTNILKGFLIFFLTVVKVT